VPDASSPDAPAASNDGLADIIVTANRRAESQQRVPIVISTFQGETVQKLNLQTTSDLPQVTPGLSFTRTLAGANAFLRGVGTTTSGYTTEAPIATYIDGLYLPNPAAAAFSFNNIERIEVLKGPQGTLYGRNTTGGLIHIITKEPGLDRSSVDASASYENYDTVRLNFYGSTPLTDNLGVNLAATYTHQGDGWGSNQFLNEDALRNKDLGFQGKLLWQPSSNTRISLRGFYDKYSSDQGNFVAIYPGSLGIDGSSYLGKYQVSSRREPIVRQRMFTASLKVEHDFGFAKLTSITGDIDSKSPSYNVQNGIVGNPVTGQSAVNVDLFGRAKTFSQELQLTSNNPGSKFQWIAGFFYYHDNTSVGANIYGTCVGAVCAGSPVPTHTEGFQKTRSYAGFGEGTYSFTPSTRLTLGLRYTSDKKSLSGSIQPLAGLPNSVAALPASTTLHPGDAYAGNPNGITTDVTFGKLTWKAVLAQDFGRDIHGYASYNRGFKSGGFNPISFVNEPSKPEVLDAFELGVKSELFDRKLRLNVGGFYYDYKDIQLRSTAPPAPTGTAILFNAASAHIKGVDVDFIAMPVHHLTLTGGLEYLDAKYSSFPAGICTTPRPTGGAVLGGVLSTTCDLSGKQLPSAPRWSYSLGLTYVVPSAAGDFELRVNDGYKGMYFWETDNRIKQHAYHLVNASVTWIHPNEHYSLQLYVKNLTGSFYYAVASEGTGGNDVYAPGAPRTYGVTARYKF